MDFNEAVKDIDFNFNNLIIFLGVLVICLVLIFKLYIRHPFRTDHQLLEAPNLTPSNIPQYLQNLHHSERIELAVLPKRFSYSLDLFRIRFFYQTQESLHRLVTIRDR